MFKITVLLLLRWCRPGRCASVLHTLLFLSDPGQEGWCYLIITICSLISQSTLTSSYQWGNWWTQKEKLNPTQEARESESESPHLTTSIFCLLLCFYFWWYCCWLDQAQPKPGFCIQSPITLDLWVAVRGYMWYCNSFSYEYELIRVTESCYTFWKCIGDRR